MNSRGGEYFFVPSVSIVKAWSRAEPGPRPTDEPQTYPPKQKGVFRIRTLHESVSVLERSSAYWELLQRPGEDPWINLMPLNATNDAQKVRLLSFAFLS